LTIRDQREGDNLYSDSVVALDVQTGKLKWHYQFTPHDVWDWDAQEPLVLADTVWQGQAAVELSDQPVAESFAHDLYVR
jgi:glucose dehydrogenase